MFFVWIQITYSLVSLVFSLKNLLYISLKTINSLGFCLSGVLVSSGCHNKIPYAGRLKQQNFIFSWSWSLEVLDQGLTGLASIKSSLSALQMVTLLCPHMAEREKELSWEGHESCRISVPPLWPHLTLITSINGLSSNTVTLELGASTYKFWGDTNIQFIISGNIFILVIFRNVILKALRALVESLFFFSPLRICHI